MDTVSYSGFRRELRGYMRKINDDAETLIVTAKDPEDTVVVMGKHDYDSMQETMRILSNPYLMEKLRRGDAQIAAGKTKQHDLLTDFDDD
ncbi:type II toxin-antitoxin system Phd/YefM family antitoxin [Lacticaseibacillus sp. N501-2]|uniref:type II toxin-antitoxin system Phd/YefM family antitoxin n=1 Tax=Lacticaseibacillus salsurae TaxID=3367729 RepID=UPI0038B355EE